MAQWTVVLARLVETNRAATTATVTSTMKANSSRLAGRAILGAHSSRCLHLVIWLVATAGEQFQQTRLTSNASAINTNQRSSLPLLVCLRRSWRQTFCQYPSHLQRLPPAEALVHRSRDTSSAIAASASFTLIPIVLAVARISARGLFQDR